MTYVWILCYILFALLSIHYYMLSIFTHSLTNNTAAHMHSISFTLLLSILVIYYNFIMAYFTPVLVLLHIVLYAIIAQSSPIYLCKH